MAKEKKEPKYIVLCKPVDGQGASLLHFTSQTSEKFVKKIFATYIKSERRKAVEYSILFYTKTQQFNKFVCDTRKFFQKERLETEIQRIAKRDSYYVKRDKWWRPPKQEYKKRTYHVVELKCFTTEELDPLWKALLKEGCYLDRDMIVEIVANFLNSHGCPTPNMDTRYEAFKRMFCGFWNCPIQAQDEYLQKKNTDIQDEYTLKAAEAKMYARAHTAKKLGSAWFRNEKFVDQICGKLDGIIAHIK